MDQAQLAAGPPGRMGSDFHRDPHWRLAPEVAFERRRRGADTALLVHFTVLIQYCDLAVAIPDVNTNAKCDTISHGQPPRFGPPSESAITGGDPSFLLIHTVNGIRFVLTMADQPANRIRIS